LSGLSGEAKLGKLPQRNLVNLLGRIREITTDAKAKKAQALWNFEFQQVWPIHQLKSCGLTKVAHFLTHQLGSV
jgi:hypothetical protein